jgi:hypothetical protein
MSIGDVLYPRLMFDMSVAGTAMFIMTSSVWTSDSGRIIAIIVSGIMAAVSLFYILCLTGLLTVPGTVFFIWSSSIMTIASAVLFIVGLWLRIRNVREVMRAGSVWVSLSLAVDSIYIMTMFTFIMVYGLFVLSGCDDNSFIGCLVAVLYVGILTAFGSRIVSDSLFVFMQRHERRIVESMKVARARGATTISITSKERSPIARQSDILLLTDTEETKHSTLGLNSHISRLILIDALCYKIVYQNTALASSVGNSEAELQSKRIVE